MRNILLSLTLCVAPSTAFGYPTYTPEDFEPLACGYELPINWNSDFMPPAPMCAMMMVEAFDAMILDCAYGSAEHCLNLAQHAVAFYLPCFEVAAKTAPQEP